MSTITIDKDNYIRAVNVAPNPRYGGLLTNTLGNVANKVNAVKFAFDAPFDGQYLFEVEYAAGTEPRPVAIYFNGTLINRFALSGLTGGWTTIARTGVGRVAVVKGQNTVLVYRTSAIPHIGNLSLLRLESVDAASEPVI